MGNAAAADKRHYARYISVSETFNGELSLAGAAWAATVIDVGRDGIGVVAAGDVPQGTAVELGIAGKILQFSVVYCEKDLIHPGKFRCGLKRVGPAENLISVFRSHGFLREA